MESRLVLTRACVVVVVAALVPEGAAGGSQGELVLGVTGGAVGDTDPGAETGVRGPAGDVAGGVIEVVREMVGGGRAIPTPHPESVI